MIISRIIARNNDSKDKKTDIFIYIQNFARNDVYTACHIFLSCVLKKFEKGSKRKVFQMNKSCEDNILSTLKAAGIS